jgi:hypothetical protein
LESKWFVGSLHVYSSLSAVTTQIFALATVVKDLVDDAVSIDGKPVFVEVEDNTRSQEHTRLIADVAKKDYRATVLEVSRVV